MKIYWVRHAEPDFSIVGDMERPLSKGGMEQAQRLASFFKVKKISAVYASPYKRSVETMRAVSEACNMQLLIIDNLRERKSSKEQIPEILFHGFAKRQWENFDFKYIGGESLYEVQKRYIAAFRKIAQESQILHREGIVIGGHVTAMSTLIKYYFNDFSWEDYDSAKKKYPWIICMEVNDDNSFGVIAISEIDIQSQKETLLWRAQE